MHIVWGRVVYSDIKITTCVRFAFMDDVVLRVYCCHDTVRICGFGLYGVRASDLPRRRRRCTALDRQWSGGKESEREMYTWVRSLQDARQALHWLMTEPARTNHFPPRQHYDCAGQRATDRASYDRRDASYDHRDVITMWLARAGETAVWWMNERPPTAAMPNVACRWQLRRRQ